MVWKEWNACEFAFVLGGCSLPGSSNWRADARREGGGKENSKFIRGREVGDGGGRKFFSFNRTTTSE